MFTQQLINGLSVGSIYALMAVGYALIYSLLNFTNFAHGISATIACFAAFYFLTYGAQNLLAGIIMGIVAAAVLAYVIQLLGYRPLLKSKTNRVYLMIMGLGISVMGDNLVIILFTGRVRMYPINFENRTIDLGFGSIGLIDLIIFACSIAALLVVQFIIQKTRMGLAIRGASYSLEATSLMGVNTFQLTAFIFMIAGALAGVAGTLLGAKYTVYPSIGTFYTNKAFICAVFGGLGSLPGAVLGALLLGIFEAMISAYVSTSLRDLFAYFVLIMILLIRPQGLLGKLSEDKA